MLLSRKFFTVSTLLVLKCGKLTIFPCDMYYSFSIHYYNFLSVIIGIYRKIKICKKNYRKTFYKNIAEYCLANIHHSQLEIKNQFLDEILRHFSQIVGKS